jgi:hypothetical protein
MCEARLGGRSLLVFRVVLDCWTWRGRGVRSLMGRVLGISEGLTLVMATVSP